MRGIRVSAATIAIVLVSVFMLGLIASAVNTYSFYGPNGNSNDWTRRSGVLNCLWDFDDHYTAANDVDRYQGGTTQYGPNGYQVIASIQRAGPQQMVFAGVISGYGERVWITHDWAQSMNSWDYVDVDDLQDNDLGIDNGGKSVWSHSPLPFGVVLSGGSKTAHTSNSENFWKSWMFDFGAWSSIGFQGGISSSKLKDFMTKYSDKIDNDKKSTYDAFASAKNKIGSKTAKSSKPVIFSRGGSWFDHSSSYDKWRNIDRKHYDTNSIQVNHKIINKGNSISFLYDSNNAKGTTNGGYVVLHGYVNDDIYCTDWDDPIEGEIKITIKYWYGSQWYQLAVNGQTTWTVSNNYHHTQSVSNKHAYRGGTDICSALIRESYLDQHRYFLIKAEFTSDDQDCTKIGLDRFEVMTIGK